VSNNAGHEGVGRDVQDAIESDNQSQKSLSNHGQPPHVTLLDERGRQGGIIWPSNESDEYVTVCQKECGNWQMLATKSEPKASLDSLLRAKY
jgi:hypothetical protein